MGPWTVLVRTANNMITVHWGNARSVKYVEDRQAPKKQATADLAGYTVIRKASTQKKRESTQNRQHLR